MDQRTRLTAQELAVLRLVVAGRPEAAIAAELGMGLPAVRRALMQAFAKVESEEESAPATRSRPVWETRVS